MTKNRVINKKATILLFILISFFVLSAFNITNIEKKVNADSSSSVFKLKDLQINYIYEPYTDSPILWNNFLTTGQGNFWQTEKIYQDDDSGINIILENFYNNISGEPYESLFFSQNTVMIFDSVLLYGSGSYMLAILDFEDTENNTTNYICEFLNFNLTDGIYFKDILINGEPFPKDENDANFRRYTFHGVQLYYPRTSGSGRKTVLQPMCSTFQEYTGIGYTSRQYAYLLLANAAMYDYDGTRTTVFKFNTLFAQISGVSYGTAQSVPTQQFSEWYTNESNQYRMIFAPPTTNNYDFMAIESTTGVYYNAETGKLYGVSNTENPVPQELTENVFILPANTMFKISSGINSTTAISLISASTTNHEAVDAFYEGFSAAIKINFYTPKEPEPEPEPEKEKTAKQIYSEQFNQHLAENYKNTRGLLGLAIIALGIPGVAFWIGGNVFGSFIQTAEYLQPALDNARQDGVSGVVDLISDILKQILTTTGAIFKQFFDELSNLPIGEQILMWVLIIGGILFSGFIGFVIIKKKIEEE